MISDAEFQEITLTAILKKLEPVPVPLEMPEQVVPDIVVPESQPVVHEPFVEAEADIEPAVVAPVVIPKVDDEDIEEDVDEDEEPEMDPDEPDHMEEDIDAVAAGSAPAADTAQIAVKWAVETVV